MKKIMTSALICTTLAAFTACDDVLQPADENIRDIDAMYNEPTYAEGILANAYILLPFSSSPQSDLATDDAVTNDVDNSFLKMASAGSWSASNNPMSNWITCRHAIQYLNLFLERADSVKWAEITYYEEEDSVDNVIYELFRRRLTGEAYAMRALYMYHLLRNQGGWDDEGNLLGVPLLLKSESTQSNYNLPRNTFQECLDQLMADADTAIALLPSTYSDISRETQIPEKYLNTGVNNIVDYNRVMGATMGGRICGRVAMAIKAQAALLAASPAFTAGNTYTYEDAANMAADVIDDLGGTTYINRRLLGTGNTWYCNTDEIANLSAGANPIEIIWRSSISESNDLETNNFPPTLYGSGYVNPTQNLVDAFPMIDGRPISDPKSGYDSEDPYFGRDPRLALYILYDGGTQGPDNTEIITGLYGEDTNDQINRESGYSTRTGYYMKKLLRSDCNPNPLYNVRQRHYTAYIRATEIVLDYAEAANEAWGPKGKGNHKYSAYDVISKIRKRAGLTQVGNDGDEYLQEIGDDQDKMRELIRNERRIELCFENHRFWDLRRWQVSLSKLNETAKGMQITEASDGTLKYNVIDVEQRKYQDYMYWGPVPYEETQKWSNLKQNKGW